MNKYKKAYEYINLALRDFRCYHEVTTTSAFFENIRTDIEHLENIRELIIEKDERESRKKKLTVGSQWECVVTCYGQDWCCREGTVVLVTKLDEDDLVFYSDTVLSHIQDEQPETQFLVCFKLKEVDQC